MADQSTKTEEAVGNVVQQRLAARLGRVKQAQARLSQKLVDFPNHHKAANWKKRQGVYADELEELELEFRLINLKEKRRGGVEVAVPTHKFEQATKTPA